MANKGFLGGLIFFTLVFGLAPNLVWVIIGAQEIDHFCNIDSPTLAAWLVVEGSVGIFVTLLTIPLALLGKFEIFGAFSALANLFFLAWNIVGAYLVSQDFACEYYNSRLYNTALAAVIFGFVNLFCSLFQVGGANKAHDDDDQ
jgi:hypothetical protein